MSRFRVTVEELNPEGVVIDRDTAEIPDHNFFVLTTGDCYIASRQVYPKSGTVTLTFKGARQLGFPSSPNPESSEGGVG